MPAEVYYKVPSWLELANVKDVLVRAEQSLAGFDPPSVADETEIILRPKRALSPLESQGIDVTWLLIHAAFPDRAVDRGLFRDMMVRCWERWQGAACLGIHCEFQDAQRIQPKGKSEEVDIRLRDGGVSLTYGAGRGVSRDREYRRQLFLNIIERLGLPMRLEDTPKGYILTHTGTGRVHTTFVTVAGTDAQVFTCEIPGADADTVLQLQEQLVREFSSKVFGYGWSLLREDTSAKERLARQVYDWTVEQKFPLARAEVTLLCLVRTLEALDELRVLGSGRSKFRRTLCRFDLPREHRGELEVIASKSGYGLELCVTNPEELPSIEQALGVTFVPC